MARNQSVIDNFHFAQTKKAKQKLKMSADDTDDVQGHVNDQVTLFKYSLHIFLLLKFYLQSFLN